MGAGLPAIQAPRCTSCPAVMLSQASQLPHKPMLTCMHMSIPDIPRSNSSVLSPSLFLFSARAPIMAAFFAQ
ncbi:hypothetical protein BFW90_01110 [Pseudomonas fluorescens]|nr:hypothetical protein BFW90_01110 [Pseudomonas fluorescens]